MNTFFCFSVSEAGVYGAALVRRTCSACRGRRARLPGLNCGLICECSSQYGTVNGTGRCRLASVVVALDLLSSAASAGIVSGSVEH